VAANDEIFVFSEYRLDVREHRVWRGNTLVPLSPKAFELLVVMVQGAGRLLEKDYLLRSVWPDSYVQDANLSVHVANLRKVLGKAPDVEQFIETVPKVGYRFVAPVSRLLQSENVSGPIHESSSLGSSEARIHSQPENVGPISVDVSAALPAPRWNHRSLRSLLLTLFIVIACGAGISIVWFTAKGHGPTTESGTSTRPLTSTPGLFLQPAFSSDGQELAYTWRSNKDAHQSIYLQHVFSDDRRLLMDTGRDDYSPAWSPNSTEIAFLHSVGDGQSLEIQIAKKQNPALRRRVATICDANDVFRNPPTLSWSPDARQLVTTDCNDKNASPALTLISVDTGRKHQLTRPPSRTWDDQAAFSPDGAWIAFRRSQGDCSDEIYLVPANGGPERKLTSRCDSIDGLAWAPDGKHILFSSGRATSLGNIWSLPLSGGSPVAVTTPLTHTSSPAVSPVGRRIAYVDSPKNVSTWRLAVDTPGNAEPFIASNFFDASAVYSPDGKYVAFRSDRSGANEIWICQSDGSAPKRITHFDGPMTGSPRWSPDGHSLVFDSRANGRADIYVVNLDNGKHERITDSAATNSDNVVPSWSRDGSLIYFSSNRTGEWQIWRHALDTGIESQVTAHGGFNAIEAPDGKSLFYVGNRERTEIRRLELNGIHADVSVTTVEPGIWHAWTISGGSLYYLKRSSFSSAMTLFRLDLRSGRLQSLGQTPQAANDSISVSPNGRWILFAQRSSTNTSIMIMDGWN
jgi:Tol biopolymer transport system component/DNA-binding winged helix-turn-helix (wHTH) protein